MLQPKLLVSTHFLLLFCPHAHTPRTPMLLPPSHHHHRSLPATISGGATAATALSPLPRLHPALSSPSRSPPLLIGIRSSTLRASAMARREAAVARLPALAQREVALALAGEVEARLGARLLPSAVPADVVEFGNRAGNALGSVDIRQGAPGSSIDVILESWLHCKVPNGAIDITSIIAFLNGSTDAPHFILDFIQGSSTSLVVILDLLPRKDLPLHSDYIDKYYQNTQLDKQRQEIEKLPQVRPYRSPSLFVRSVLSPTAIAVNINCGEDGQSVMEEIVRAQLATAAKEVLRIWLDSCADSTAEVEETERESMLKRDCIVKSKSVDIDLSANFPRLFDPDVSSRVLAEIQKAFGVQDGKQN